MILIVAKSVRLGLLTWMSSLVPDRLVSTLSFRFMLRLFTPVGQWSQSIVKYTTHIRTPTRKYDYTLETLYQNTLLNHTQALKRDWEVWQAA